VEFCGLTLRVDPGVYVPRWHTELIAERAATRLPAEGTAVDLCTGAGAIAAVLAARRPRARVLATEVDPGAVSCARANGVEVLAGDLFAPLPDELRADVLTAVVPYVPTGELGLLQRDTFAFESTLAYDGGPDGADVLRRVVAGAPRVLRPGGALILELGAGQPELLGLEHYDVIVDEDGDVRGIEATLS
jgi:release factor glutamine methyltransferase